MKLTIRFSERIFCQRVVSTPPASNPLVGEKRETDCQIQILGPTPELMNVRVGSKLVSAFFINFPGDSVAL